MKSLTLFRHAKSSWKHPVADEYRPLNGRGLNQAIIMAKNCTMSSPDSIFSSSAHRAVSTALIYIEQNNLQMESFYIKRELYEFSGDRLLVWLSTIGDEFNSVWLFGHNPGLNELSKLLLGYEIDNIVTSGYLQIQIDTTHWKDAGQSASHLVEFNNRELTP